MTSSTSRAPSGAGMDRVISQKSGRFIRFLPWVGATIAIVAVIYFFATYQNATFAIENTRISIAPVIDGEFDDYIPIRGRVTPLKTVYLDMIEGGQVQKRMVEDGAMVNAGDLLVSLNNTSLQLDVSRNEAMVTEQ
ncbi:MAG: HlyD family secretion protein, partial [Candidatus Azotimanducaceae bacterium]